MFVPSTDSSSKKKEKTYSRVSYGLVNKSSYLIKKCGTYFDLTSKVASWYLLMLSAWAFTISSHFSGHYENLLVNYPEWLSVIMKVKNEEIVSNGFLTQQRTLLAFEISAPGSLIGSWLLKSHTDSSVMFSALFLIN